MAFKFRCPECGASILASEDMVGCDTRCPSCLATFPIPELSSASSSADEDDRPRYEHDSDSPDYGDNEPRPRRRRRRPPPPPSSGSYSALTILGALFGLLLLGCCLCGGGGYLMLPGEKWHTHNSPQGGYSVEVPIVPSKNLQALGIKPEPGVNAEGGILWKRGEAYILMDVDRPPGQNDEELLRELVKEATHSSDVKRVVRDESITVSGYPGREVEFVDADGGTNTMRFIVTDRKVYIISGGGRFVKPGNPNIRRFLDSFKVTKAKEPAPKRW